MNSYAEIELMSPVGSFETLMAAIQGGAKSVYFGVGKLNMRSASTLNFNLDDLQTLVDICNNNNVKAYLTVNTIIYDEEIAQMQEILDFAKKTGIHAIIATDFAVLHYAKKIGIETHASTQLNISNIEAVKHLAQYCDVMVLARELSLEKIKHIANEIEKQKITGPSGNLVRLEVFVHGALCMSISGKCYLSLHHHNKSANRGECLQNCRRAYTVTERETGYQLDIENEYIMSPKDLCTIHILDKILNTGVKVLKIEGRARSPEYVKTVTRCYKEAIDAYFNNTFTNEKIKIWINELKKVYNRGFWEGYYLGSLLGEWSEKYGSSATKEKIYAGKVTNYFKQINVAEILIEAQNLKENDEILIIGPTTGVVEHKIQEIRVNDIKVNEAYKGTKCSIFIPHILRRNDKVYLYKDKD
jgi:putative protease